MSRHVFITSVPNEGLLKCLLRIDSSRPTQKGSVSAFGCFKWLFGTIKYWGKVSDHFSWAILSVLHFLRSWKSMWNPRYSNTETTDLWAVLWHQTFFRWTWKQHVRHAKKKNSDTFHESWFVNRESYNGVLLIKLNSWILTIVQRRLLSSSHTMLSLNLLLKKNLVGGFKYFVCSTRSLGKCFKWVASTTK